MENIDNNNERLLSAVSHSTTSRPEDLHADTKRPPGTGCSLWAQGILFFREAELHRLQEEQCDESGQEQPGETFPLFGKQSCSEALTYMHLKTYWQLTDISFFIAALLMQCSTTFKHIINYFFSFNER